MTNEELIRKREKDKIYSREWRKRPGNKEKMKQQSREWREKNPERAKEHYRRARERHPENLKNWIRKNPIRYWVNESIRHHKRKGYEVKMSKAEIEEIAKKTLNCPYCGIEIDYSPLKGKVAKNSPSLDRINNGNLMTEKTTQIICQKCNKTKSDRTHLEFIGYCEQITRKFKDLI